MNPWTYTLPRGSEGGRADFDLSTLEYEYVDDFIEENNHPGKMEDGQVSVTYLYVCIYYNGTLTLRLRLSQICDVMNN